MMHTLNDHKVEVPVIDGLEVRLNPHGPGAYDCLTYKGYEILTQECEDEPDVYTGPFYIAGAGEGIDPDPFPTLREAIDEIDDRAYAENLARSKSARWAAK